MELKDYQKSNLDALDRFLSCVEKSRTLADAFNEFWQTNNPPLTPFPGSIIEPYKNNVKGAPHICHKVPTGGGKTYIASAALKVAIDHLNPLYKVVVWLVPSNAILEQTLRNLRNKQHPYRQRIDTDFQNRVEVFDKQQALTGHGFNLTAVRENLCILVMSFDSFRTSNKEGRKVYQENGYLQSFAPLVSSQLEGDDEVQLMKVLQAVNPVVVVDESHNATSDLSERMLNDLYPSLVLDLTATPRENSNIICFTDALELKRNNMVKLPVIVYNHTKKSQVIDSALHLQRRLEQTANQDGSGNYIRPIVLFQAESKQQGSEDRETFEKVKNTLLSLKIPEEQIKIKTADIDELKDVDLMSRDCPVRYIITINALKEGWDCPFAYILASLADRSSSVDVEQIVGRVLRLPYARRNHNDILNLSYVLTASAKFQETLDNVVKGLNHAGFSDRDYRAVNTAELPCEAEKQPVNPGSLFPGDKTEEVPTNDDFDLTQITFKADEYEHYTSCSTKNEKQPPNSSAISSVEDIIGNAQKQAEKMNKQIESNDDVFMVTPEIAPQVKTATIQTIFADSAKQVVLPMFFISNDSNQESLFGRPSEIKLEGQHLLKTFKLSAQSADITFVTAEKKMYEVDIDEKTDEHTPRYKEIRGKTYDFILDYIRKAETSEAKLLRCSHVVAETMGKMIPLTQKDIQGYVARIFESYNDEQLDEFTDHLQEYTAVIKEKILALEEEHKEKEFRNMIDTDLIFTKAAYSIPNKITLKSPSQSIIKMLHTKEEAINGFEADVINAVANLESVEWWTRNVEKRGFYINGFINHYPDFIIKTKKGKIVLLETKGDHLEAEKKIRLGNIWANKAGNEYRYCLVYDKRQVDGSYTKSDFLDLMKNL
ncbi:MAG: DEAD/DEAH box helicase family protein [Bacteroidales bacterium]|nr:DEAD/DEAH box helicase family protein [Bacteroidales bacterium]